MVDGNEFQHLLIGSSLAGLHAAQSLRAKDPSGRIRLIEQTPAPGGSTRTLRSEGYVCELGPFAVTENELRERTEPLPKPPPAIPALPAAAGGHVWTGERLVPTAVLSPPWSFRGGMEDLVTAYRRELGDCLQLGRAATMVTPGPDGWQVTLGGEVRATLAAPRLTLALSTTSAARLLARLEPRLHDTSQRLATEPRAFVFAGFTISEVQDHLTGYGIVPADGVVTDLAEVIFCTNVFERRAMPGHALVRIEVGGGLTSRADPDLAAAATAELGRWTGMTARPRFVRVHRFASERRDAAWLECRTRIQSLTELASGLLWLPPRD
ncbi:MAG: NAD(P)-binding protein [Planctomycetes bacterium]|nr:NAD(P)-binding protein [Planctomycetota bacterium]